MALRDSHLVRIPLFRALAVTLQSAVHRFLLVTSTRAGKKQVPKDITSNHGGQRLQDKQFYPAHKRQAIFVRVRVTRQMEGRRRAQAAPRAGDCSEHT